MNTTIPQLSSLYQAVDIQQEIAPLIVGERTNPTGSKKFRELLLADDFDGCLQVAVDQERIGAHVLDLSAAWAGRNEIEDLEKLTQLFSQNLKIPLMIDSTSPDAIEKALRVYPGRPVINSINLEDGGTNLHRICYLAKKYGACVVALTIDEQGMAMDTARKLEIAKRIYSICTEEYNLSPSDIFFDPLTFTVASGDETLEDAAIQTMDAIRGIKTELKGCNTILGLSNISFGLPPAARRILNAVFLNEAVEAGLDAVIINPLNCISLDTIDTTSRTLAGNLLHNIVAEGKKPLIRFIEHFETIVVNDQQNEDDSSLIQPEKVLFEAVLQGSKNKLEDTLSMLLDSHKPLDIVNQILVPAMKKVGDLFGAGEMLLPFVLQSAETMRASVDILEPYMDKNSEDTNSCKVLLATVQGDVHDIGKNLVNIILSNNGYEVIDLGIKVPAEIIVEEAKKLNVDIICLSGLLVKSALIMKESLPLFQENGLSQPILLGGAALTRKFVATECSPQYDSPVIYCKDAFSGLKAIHAHEEGVLKTTTWFGEEVRKEDNPSKIVINPSQHIPTPPFLGVKELEVQSDSFIDLIKTQILFRGRWGYTRGSMEPEEYSKLIDEEVQPKYDDIRSSVLTNHLFEPKVRYGWFDCYRENDTLFVKNENRTVEFTFPRQKGGGLCLSDYFNSAKDGSDVAGFFIVTIGDVINDKIQQLYKENQYNDYLHLHGFSVAAAEALAEYTHNHMRNELGIQSSGERYSFGYSACPDLELQKPLLQLLQADKIGISLTENMQMVPEQSVSAIVVHHSQASYFAV